ncbi:SET domain-containing protein SmydA-8 [Onthophagus taurus]|uniref:SET domain-containing protein SmydA-8 n=1 Tax=Onthophagus taurus TaxID=166361 RepID=UPI0039BE9BF6
MSDVPKCAVCQKKAPQRCAGCHSVHYCSREHQKLGWKSHKKYCKPFKVCEDDVLGRYLVATKPLNPGDVILKEPPLIWGPAQQTVPVCLGCGKIVTAKTQKPCQKCGWPMCSDLCQNSPSHIPECSYTIKRGDKVSINNFNITHPSYQSIIILRCLYQKQFLPHIWVKIEQLECHSEDRKKTFSYINDKHHIVEFIKRFYKIDSFTDEEILKVCGIVMVNGHEVPLNEPPHVAIYEQCSLFEHSCRANCCKSFTSNGEILISAGIKIEKGDHLSICYTDPLWGTPNRRHHLNETKFFWCKCLRCSDSSELGTFFSAMKCQNENCKGLVLPKSFLEEEKNFDTLWSCGLCNFKMSERLIFEILENIGKQLQTMPKGVISICKNFIRESEKYLSKNHYHLIDVKFALCQVIGENPPLSEVSDSDLEFKTRICNQLLEVVRILVPAEKRILGVVLFELHAAIAEMGRRKVENHSFEEPNDVKASLLDSEKILKEVVEILKHEPIELPEGKICQQARKNLQEIQAILKSVHVQNGNALM